MVTGGRQIIEDNKTWIDLNCLAYIFGFLFINNDGIVVPEIVCTWKFLSYKLQLCHLPGLIVLVLFGIWYANVHVTDMW